MVEVGRWRATGRGCLVQARPPRAFVTARGGAAVETVDEDRVVA
jgi:hypothetical protein